MARGDDGVVFEDEKEGALTEGSGLDGAVEVGFGFAFVAGGGHEVGEELVHVEVVFHGEMGGGEHDGGGFLENSSGRSAQGVFDDGMRGD